MKTTFVARTVGCGCLIAACTGAYSQPYHFNTIEAYANRSSDGTNRSARFALPFGIATDQAGSLYVADYYNHTIRRLSPSGTNWVVSTLAGRAGYAGTADGTNSDALFNAPAGVAVDNSTNIYVADSDNHTVRKIAPEGTNWVVSTLAGWPGHSGGSDGASNAARFCVPSGIALGSGGVLYVADTLNSTIRRMTPMGDSWVVSTLAGFAGASGTADGTGNEARFTHPTSVAVDGTGRIYVADSDNYTIRRITQNGSSWVVSTLAGSVGTSGSDDGTNDIARFGDPQGISVDSAGVVYVVEGQTNTVRRITQVGTDWVVTTLAGLAGSAGATDGTNNTARFNCPKGVAAAAQGKLFIADTYNDTIRQITIFGTNAVTKTLAGLPLAQNATPPLSQPSGLAVDNAGCLYLADAGTHTIRKFTRFGTRWEIATLAGLPGGYGSADGTNGTARFAYPRGIALDSAGILYMADTGNHTIRRVVQAGTNWVVTTVAGVPGSFGTADGTNSAARFNAPYDITVDTAGNLFVADSVNNAIRKITPVGTNWVTRTIAGVAGPAAAGYADGTNSAARFDYPQSLVADAAGALYVADTWNRAIRKIAPVGTNWVTSTIAGLGGMFSSPGSADGTNDTARFYYPRGIALGAATTLFVVDSGNANIRKITPVGTNWVVSTLAGLARINGMADGTGTEARFNNPGEIAVDMLGNAYVADTSNNAIRAGQPVPSLNLIFYDTALVLSWPMFATNFTLETAISLEPWAEWTPLGTGSLSGDNCVFTNLASSTNAYFRLRK